MKKIVSLLLCLALFSSVISWQTAAAGSATLSVKDFSVGTVDKYAISDIKKSLKAFADEELSKEQLKDKYGAQLRHVDIIVSGIDNLNAIYGLQFNISIDSNAAALAYITTDLQNSSKIGVSKWEGFLTPQDADYKTAKVLLYGTGAVNSTANRSQNRVSNDSYRVATLYYLVGKELKKDFRLTVKVEDVASKDKQSNVKSILGEFKSETVANATVTKDSHEFYGEMLGAQIRITGKQGLRFGTKLLKTGFINNCTDVSYGTLIAVTSQLNGGELTFDTKATFYNAPAEILDETKDSVLFCGAITDFKDASYNNVNFTARSYVKYRVSGETTDRIYYFDSIVRNVETIKSILGIS